LIFEGEDVSAKPQSRIFISYRREDSEHAAGRLAADLRKDFPPQQVFLDIASIDPGADFVLALKRGLADCAAVLVVIGPRWLAATDDKRRRRLDSPDDWVRQEIAESLRRPDVQVVPIVLDSTAMPNAEDLPEDIRALTRRQALTLTSRHWSSDIARLVELLRRSPGVGASAEGAPRGPVPEGAKAGRLSRVSATHWGLFGAALVILVTAGLVAFRPSLIGMRTVAIPGAKPLYAPYKTGDVFQECVDCPEMVVIVPEVVETGGGMRKSSDPILKPFAIGKYEVTRAQYYAAGVNIGQGCWDAAGDSREKMRERNSKAPGFEQTDDHPIVCVDIGEIRSYFAWLNSRTGAVRAYRLPSEAEWFHAAMAGTGDVDPWGDVGARACEYANVYDSTAAAGKPDRPAAYECSDGYVFSAPVGRFKPNAWGLHDTMGNVEEWLEDCGRGEPQSESCNFRVVAGGHYREALKDSRRYLSESSNGRKNYTGFRVARFL